VTQAKSVAKLVNRFFHCAAAKFSYINIDTQPK
jgi:hypothetical protein